LVGCLAALLIGWNLIPRNRFCRLALKAAAALGVVFMAYMAGTSKMADADLYYGLFTVVALAIGVILIVLMLWPPGWALQILRVSPLRWLGRISYGVYLWHWPIREILCPSINTSPIWRILATAILSVTVAALSFYFVETPFLRLKERFAGSGEERKVGAAQRLLLTAECTGQAF
jgi:peptidoglycan/LPS O-acetylase OafA/YrhL